MPEQFQKFREMYNLLLERFGHQKWWPGDTPLEICVGAILTQNTNWGNVEKAIVNIKSARAMSVKKLVELSHERLAELIRPAGYFNIKSKRLKNFIDFVKKNYRGSLTKFLHQPSMEKLRDELLSVNGIGPETADSIILYAADRPTFVVDAYTRRILTRHKLIDETAAYDDMKKLFEKNLPRDAGLFNDFHAQIVAVGKNHCKTRPTCDDCPLREFQIANGKLRIDTNHR